LNRAHDSGRALAVMRAQMEAIIADSDRMAMHVMQLLGGMGRDCDAIQRALDAGDVEVARSALQEINSRALSGVAAMEIQDALHQRLEHVCEGMHICFDTNGHNSKALLERLRDCYAMEVEREIHAHALGEERKPDDGHAGEIELF